MFGIKATFIDETRKVKDAADRGVFRNEGHAAASIRKDAVASIVRSPEPSAPGEPVHTRRGLARRAILYAVDRARRLAVVGFVASRVGTALSAHEHGMTYKGADYPARPTMGPALDRNLDRFAAGFAGSIRR